MKSSRSLHVWLLCLTWLTVLNTDAIAAYRHLYILLFFLYFFTCYWLLRNGVKDIYIHWSAKILAAVVSSLAIFVAWYSLKSNLPLPEWITPYPKKYIISYFFVADHLISALVGVLMAIPLLILLRKFYWVPPALNTILYFYTVRDAVFDPTIKPIVLIAVLNIMIAQTATITATLYFLKKLMERSYYRPR